MSNNNNDKSNNEKSFYSLDESDISLMNAYSTTFYSNSIKKGQENIKATLGRIKEKIGVQNSDCGLASPDFWDIQADTVALSQEKSLLVARCNKIINADSTNSRYLIDIENRGKYVVSLFEDVAPADIEEGMRVGVDKAKHEIHLPLPPKIDPTVTLMEVDDKPDVTYGDIGGYSEQIKRLREVVELPISNPEAFIKLGIDPPKGVLLYGLPGTGKTLCARAVANRTDACFIRVISSELVKKYIGEGARLVREIFNFAKLKKACILFFDEVDAIGGARSNSDSGNDNEVQRTMLELINQLDGFDARGNIKVIMATNRPDTLDPALLRPGRLDRKIEFGLPDLEGRTKIFKIHTKSMSVENGIRYELLARLCTKSTGAEIRSVCTEAGMFAIRARRKVVSESDFFKAVQKVINDCAKFSATSRYLQYN